MSWGRHDRKSIRALIAINFPLLCPYYFRLDQTTKRHFGRIGLLHRNHALASN